MNSFEKLFDSIVTLTLHISSICYNEYAILVTHGLLYPKYVKLVKNKIDWGMNILKMKSYKLLLVFLLTDGGRKWENISVSLEYAWICSNPYGGGGQEREVPLHLNFDFLWLDVLLNDLAIDYTLCVKLLYTCFIDPKSHYQPSLHPKENGSLKPLYPYNGARLKPRTPLE